MLNADITHTKITNLIICTSYHRQWLDKFNASRALVPESKLLASVGLVCNIIKLSNEVKDTDKHLLLEHWTSTPQQREMMLAKNPPAVFMDITSNKHTVAMNFPSLIKRERAPVENVTSHPEANVGKINETAILGF